MDTATDDAACSAMLSLAIKYCSFSQEGLVVYQEMKITVAIQKENTVTTMQTYTDENIGIRVWGLTADVLTQHHTTTERVWTYSTKSNEKLETHPLLHTHTQF